MKITRTVIVLDAADVDAVSEFWAGLLDGTVEKDEDWHSINKSTSTCGSRTHRLPMNAPSRSEHGC